MANLGISQNTIAILQKYQFRFQKKYGQNYKTGLYSGDWSRYRNHDPVFGRESEEGLCCGNR